MKAIPAHAMGKIILMTVLLSAAASHQAAVLLSNLSGAPGDASGNFLDQETSVFNDIYSLEVTAAPKPGAYALAAGLGLVAFIPCRRSRGRLASQ